MVVVETEHECRAASATGLDDLTDLVDDLHQRCGSGSLATGSTDRCAPRADRREVDADTTASARDDEHVGYGLAPSLTGIVGRNHEAVEELTLGSSGSVEDAATRDEEIVAEGVVETIRPLGAIAIVFGSRDVFGDTACGGVPILGASDGVSLFEDDVGESFGGVCRRLFWVVTIGHRDHIWSDIPTRITGS